MVMFIIAIVLMIPYIAIKTLEFVLWFMDDPIEALCELAPLLAFMGMFIYFSELIIQRM